MARTVIEIVLYLLAGFALVETCNQRNVSAGETPITYCEGFIWVAIIFWPLVLIPLAWAAVEMRREQRHRKDKE